LLCGRRKDGVCGGEAIIMPVTGSWCAIEFGPGALSTNECQTNILKFFEGIARSGLGTAISNMSARLGGVVGPNASVPYLLASSGSDSCYLSSFTRLFMDGAAQEFAVGDNALLKLSCHPLRLSGRILRGLGLDDLVIVNSNLYSTCHVEDWPAADMSRVTAALIEMYPANAIWVRGLIDRFHQDDLTRLEQEGYLVSPARPVEILDASELDWKVPSNLKKDLKKIHKIQGAKPFVGGAFSDDDFEVMAGLCRKTTVDAHSTLMPQYTPEFFRACAHWDDCRFVGFRSIATGQIVGFATLITGSKVYTCGTLGFDSAGPHARLFYPALSALEMQQAVEARRPFNLGFGAVEFKRFRGTRSAVEMNALYVRHLPRLKRQMWTAIMAATRAAAGPVMRRL
jgi:hypothetical protein